MSRSVQCLCLLLLLVLPVIIPAQIWVARYNGPVDSVDVARAIAVDDAGFLYVTGSSIGSGTGYDFATVKYDSMGVEQWVRRYNGPSDGEDEVTAMAVDGQCNVYVTGLSFVSSIDFDFVTVKYDSAGVQQWVAPYNGPGGGWDFARAIAVDDGGIYVTGPSEGLGTDFDYATVKYDTAGVQQWVARFNGPSNGDDLSTAIVVDNAGFLYVAGGSLVSGTDFDFVTVKYDSAGVQQWVAPYDGPTHGEDAANAIAIDDAGSIYVTGPSEGVGTDFDYATVKYDSAGVEQWVARYHGSGNGQDAARAIVVKDGVAIYVTGESEGEGTDFDYATVKYFTTGIEEQRFVRKEDNYIVSTIFSGRLQLPEGKKCKVFDITGRVVEPERIQSGIYFIEVNGVVTQKVVKVR